MENQDIRAKRRIFMDSCRHYNRQVERRDQILIEQANKKKYLSEPDIESEMEEIELQLLEDNIQYVDRIFTRISKKYGTASKDIVFRIYVEGEKAELVAAGMYISRISLLRKIREWMESCL